MRANESKLIEQLFLDIPIQDLLNNKFAGTTVVEPWKSDYINAIRDGRFGDALWARYHMFGGVHNGLIEGTNMTVLESIEEDAIGYRVGHPDLYAEALLFYATTKASDGHPEVIEMLFRIGHQDAAELHVSEF
ncbi:hypothetical protein N7462_009054 [Penicillium macrosclerotiorum]|uniref:uncharacterized protein n=1 Tax=Penicillium macrosclerotiorum TaxID=303699 RepID=UPI0025484C6D|nr:uncharacterized protein N7462_009054 [Penicillium macrosclerotiorum]KAJ5676157.1 hypothetical protein N7462_009054 [Penicillium macrosclerotiorum]